MIEIPESIIISKQLKETILGKEILHVAANQSPHKFAWFFGDPDDYEKLLIHKKVTDTKAHGGMVEIYIEDARLLLSEGAKVSYYPTSEKHPKKHQLQIEFTDHTYLYVSIQMYGGISAYPEGANDNPYYLISKDKISPFHKDFNKEYFMSLIPTDKVHTAKSFLATEQRIPGLGNGVLQDILWNAKIHPKRKMNTLTDIELDTLYHSVIDTLTEMVSLGGRDIEKDIFGENGGYKTALSKNTVGTPCYHCGTEITKESYLGGSIYVCNKCQK